MSSSFREDWRRGSLLLATILGLGIVGVVFILLFADATPAPAAPASTPRPVQRAVAPAAPAIKAFDRALIIAAAVAGLIAVGSTVYCMMLIGSALK